MASAYVSGVAALLIGHNPELTPEDVRRVITSTAHDLGPQKDQFGAGLVDANSAILSVGTGSAAEFRRPPAH